MNIGPKSLFLNDLSCWVKSNKSFAEIIFFFSSCHYIFGHFFFIYPRLLYIIKTSQRLYPVKPLVNKRNAQGQVRGCTMVQSNHADVKPHPTVYNYKKKI